MCEFILTALVGIILIPPLFILPCYLFELWWAKRIEKRKVTGDDMAESCELVRVSILNKLRGKK